MKLTGVDKRYGDTQVLDRLTLDFPDEGVLALLGPSGCGKTTLLRLLAGLERADGGVLEMPDVQKVSMVFQEDRLLPVLTALDNVRAVLGPQEGELARECLAGCGLAGAEHLYPDELSGGMQRRVAIARALAFRGDLLLLDEAFKGLDPATRESVHRFVFEGPLRAPRTILVTHDVDEALAVADRVWVMAGLPLRMEGGVPLSRNRSARAAEHAKNRANILSMLTKQDL